MQQEFEFEAELTFSATEYLISMKQVQVATFDPSNQRLAVEVEEKLSGLLWRGEFTAKYIEDITAKAGCPKKFAVFNKMLLSALKCDNESVFIDLLTYADLEQLKNKKGPGQSSVSGPQSNKRYIILTFVAEFERVHYPLPLSFIEEPDEAALRKTIERMRFQIEMQKSNAFSSYTAPVSSRLDDFASIEVENARLREQVSQLESSFSKSHQEFFSLSQDKFFRESEYSQYKREAQREIGALQEQVRAAEEELQHLQGQIKQRTTQTSGFSLNSGMVNGQSQHDHDYVKRQLEEISLSLEDERNATGHLVQKQEEEIESCRKELESKRENEAKLRKRAEELQAELEYTLKRIDQLQRGITTPVRRKQQLQNSGSRGTSPYQRNSNNGSQKRTPSNSNTRPGVPSYTRPTRNFSNTKNPVPPAQPFQKRPSPARVPANYKPPHLRQGNPAVRSNSNNGRSGSQNARDKFVSKQQQQQQQQTSKERKPAAAGSSSTGPSVFDRLYGGGAAARRPVKEEPQVQIVNVGAAAAEKQNKENEAKMNLREENVDVKDIDSKLSRLQDLLKMAKGN